MFEGNEEEIPGNTMMDQVVQQPQQPPLAAPRIQWWELFTRPRTTVNERNGWCVMLHIFDTVVNFWFVFVLTLWLLEFHTIYTPLPRTYANSWDYQLAVSSLNGNFTILRESLCEKRFKFVASFIVPMVDFHRAWIRVFEMTVCSPWCQCELSRKLIAMVFATFCTLILELQKIIV